MSLRARSPRGFPTWKLLLHLRRENQGSGRYCDLDAIPTHGLRDISNSESAQVQVRFSTSVRLAGLYPPSTMPSRERGSLAQSPETDAPSRSQETSSPALATYDRAAMGTLPAQRVEEWPESSHKAAVIRAIKHRLMIDPGPARKIIHRSVGHPRPRRKQ